MAAANMSGIPTERANMMPAGNKAEPRCTEAGSKAEAGHREVVERVLERIAFERLVDARHHHEHHQHRRDEHGRETERRVVAEPARDGRQRAEQNTEHRAEEELAGVVEVVVAIAHLRSVDDLREERGQSDDAGGEAEAELGMACERDASAGLAGCLECRAVVGA